jgi:hypothetical protein
LASSFASLLLKVALFTTRHTAMAKRKNNENVDPDAPPVPQWKPPTEAPEWRDWMKDGVYGSNDLNKFGQALSLLSKLPLPFFSAPDREILSKSAAAELDKANPIFEQHLAQSRNTP